MKTKFLKYSLLITTMAISASAYAQTIKKVSDDDRQYSNYDNVTIKNGKQIEEFKTNWNNTFYKAQFVDNKLTELYVDGEQIPPAKWGEYSAVLAKIKEQIRLDKIQAKKDMEQAVRDQQQAKRDQQQAARDQQQAKLDQERAGQDMQQAKRDQEQALRDQQEAGNAQAQAKRDQEQAAKDQIQARKDQEQARLDQIQARKDQEQAKEDQRVMKLMIADLVSDHIINSENNLHTLTLNTDELIVNGKKQPEALFNKYKTKYKRFTRLNFSYGNEDGVRTYQGLHISH